MSTTKIALLILALNLIVWPKSNNLMASYASTEILFIPWGDSVGQLMILEPEYEESEGGIQYLRPAGGPNQGFVGVNDVVYVSSVNPGYFKAFTHSGETIINIAENEPGYNDLLFSGSVQRFYVDSLNKIYFQSFAPRNFIAIADSLGHLLEQISPFSADSDITINMIGFNSDDVLSFDCWYHGFYTYKNHTFLQGGSPAWLAKDGNYYNAQLVDSTFIKFYRFNSPNIHGVPDAIDTIRQAVEGGITGFEFLGVDDSLDLYLHTYRNNEGVLEDGVQIYTKEFRLKEDFTMSPHQDNRFMWYMKDPFLRRDGAIYEFRCLDDGLHVIKWAKQ